MRPIADAGDKRVLDRVDVAILDVAGVVGVVSDQVLPKTALPAAALASHLPHAAQLLVLGIERANRDLINRQRIEKSASPGGSVHTACRWSGSTTNASI